MVDAGVDETHGGSARVVDLCRYRYIARVVSGSTVDNTRVNEKVAIMLRDGRKCVMGENG